jgi:hypothetical protein
MASSISTAEKLSWRRSAAVELTVVIVIVEDAGAAALARIRAVASRRPGH